MGWLSDGRVGKASWYGWGWAAMAWFGRFGNGFWTTFGLASGRAVGCELSVDAVAEG